MFWLVAWGGGSLGVKVRIRHLLRARGLFGEANPPPHRPEDPEPGE